MMEYTRNFPRTDIEKQMKIDDGVYKIFSKNRYWKTHENRLWRVQDILQEQILKNRWKSMMEYTRNFPRTDIEKHMKIDYGGYKIFSKNRYWKTDEIDDGVHKIFSKKTSASVMETFLYKKLKGDCS